MYFSILIHDVKDKASMKKPLKYGTLKYIFW